MIQKNITYTQAVDLFIGANIEWLSETDQPLVTALYKSAHVLDQRTSAALLSEYRQLFKEVLRNKPIGTTKVNADAFDELMGQFLEP